MISAVFMSKGKIVYFIKKKYGNLQKDFHNLVELGSFFLKEPFWLSQLYKALLVTHTIQSLELQSNLHNTMLWFDSKRV